MKPTGKKNVKSRVSLWLSPLSYFCAFYFYQTVATPVFSLSFLPDADTYSYALTFFVSFIFLGAVVLGWFLSPRLGQKFANTVLSNLSIGQSGKSFGRSYLRIIAFAFFLLFVLSFIVLAQISGAGALWITDSRIAYQFYRNGVGVFYAITVTFLTLSYIFSIFGCSGKAIALAMVKTLFFMIIAFFLGSKAVVLGIFIIGLLYYNYNISPLHWSILATCLIICFIGISILQILQGTANNFLQTILYADYFHNTSKFIQRFDEEFGLQFGKVFISNIWAYVPRILYPDKPYEYGFLLIHKVLFPGAAEQSFTPGILPWSGAYLDFGLAGVVASGIFNGLILGWCHNYYLRKLSGVIGFIILIKLGGFPALFAYFPIPAFLLVALPLLSLTLILFKPLPK